MFHHILVPLDLSTRAEQALPIAARLARASRGTITLLHVVDLFSDTLSYGIAAPYIAQDIMDDTFSSARYYLEQQCRTPCLEGIPVNILVTGGNPAECIIMQADAPIDLIVISSHGYTGVKRWIIGSVAERIARHALVPVLILRHGQPMRTHGNFDGNAMVSALVPLDNSPRSQDVLGPVAELVAALSPGGQGALHLIQMVKVPENASIEQRLALFRSARQYLMAMRQKIRHGLVAQFGPELHPTVTCSVSQTDDIAEGIVEAAEKGEEQADPGKRHVYDLIAMTTHGRSGIHRWTVGSVAERVLHTTRLPILIVRPEDILIKARQQRGQRTQAGV